MEDEDLPDLPLNFQMAMENKHPIGDLMVYLFTVDGECTQTLYELAKHFKMWGLIEPRDSVQLGNKVSGYMLKKVRIL